MKDWKIGTLISSAMVADNVKSLRFSLEGWVPHSAGQHYDLRLTAANGYQAERSYSVASAPEEEGIVEYGVQLLQNGEVSPYLYALHTGDKIEMRGPIGGHFVWSTEIPGALVLIGGGSGMVPLMSMLRHHERHLSSDSERDVIFLASARDIGKILYADEIKKYASQSSKFSFVPTLTDSQPSDWTGFNRRIDKEMIIEACRNVMDKMPMIYICGPTPFVEAVANTCVSIGFNSHQIKTERFGGV